MILTNKVNVKINSYNFKHFNELGYNVRKNDIIEIKINELFRYSEVIINTKCDICGDEKEMKNSYYNQNCDRNNNLYCCTNCKSIRTKKTNLEKYGVENVSQSEKIKEKKRKLI